MSISPINSLFIEERKMEDKNYKIGSAQTVYVGEPLIKRRTYLAKIQSKLVAIPEISSVLASSGFGVIPLPQGTPFEVKYDVFINGEKFSAMEVPTKNGIVAVLFDVNGLVREKVLRNGQLLPESFSVKPINANVVTKRPEKILDKKMIENFELIYGGVNNNQINLTYREFSPDDVARTAFFQELTYPTDSEFLRYKSMKVKVHNVSSEGINFEVVAD